MSLLLKTFLIALAILWCLLCAWILVRELRLTWRVRRSVRTHVQPSPVAIEYGTRDLPAWGRQRDPERVARAMALAGQLKELGE